VHVDGGASGKDAHESAFQAQIKRLATACGWMYYHTHRSDMSDAGFPDTVLVRGDRLIFAELKLDRSYSQPSAEQAAWLEALGGTSAEVYLWRPSDIETIRDILNRPNPFERKPTYAELEALCETRGVLLAASIDSATELRSLLQLCEAEAAEHMLPIGGEGAAND
jgi:hypothetical protein